MPRYQKDYILIKRKLKSGKTVYYYRLAGEKTHLSTGKDRQWKAAEFVENEILPKLKQSPLTLREYAEPFFQWEQCPHVQRLLNEGKSIMRIPVKVATHSGGKLPLSLLS